jgi:hypothetical protein
MNDDAILPKLPVPEFVPAARLRVEGPDKDGHELVAEHTVNQVKVRHGLRKPAPPPQMPAGMRPPPGAMPAEMPK